jgi:hypothetical protein
VCFWRFNGEVLHEFWIGGSFFSFGHFRAWFAFWDIRDLLAGYELMKGDYNVMEWDGMGWITSER